MRSFYPVTLDQKTIFVGRKIAGKKIINGVEVYNSIKLYLIEPLEKLGEASNAFDGIYSFKLNRYNPSEGARFLGSGDLIIKDGKISVSTTKRVLDTSSTKFYDTFKGQIDKEGNIVASFDVNALHGKGSPRTVGFSGNIAKKRLNGKFDDYFEMIIELTE